jgi:hypothetical protein
MNDTTLIQGRTREERDVERERLRSKLGSVIVLIPEDTADAIATDIDAEGLWRVTWKVYPGVSLQFYVTPIMTATREQLNAAIGRLSAKYGNAPFLLATDFEMHRFTFTQM